MARVVALIALFWFVLSLYALRRARPDQLVRILEIVFGFWRRRG